MAFLIVIPIAMLLAIVFDKKTEETIALSMIWASLLAYLCGIIYELWIATYLVAGIAVLSTVGTVVYGIRKKKIANLITPGLLQYLLLCGYYMLVFKGRFVNSQDSLVAYEKYPREFYYVNDICRFKEPVGVMVWKYLSLKMWPNYSEGMQLFAGAAMQVAMLVFFFRQTESDKKRDKILKFCLGLFFMLFLPLTYKGGVVAMQYDYITGILTAFVLAAYMALKQTGDRYYKVLVISSLVFLIHIKSTGIILALICLMIIAGMEMVYEEQEGIRRYYFLAVCTVAVLLSKLSWTFFCKLNDAEEKFSIGQAIHKMKPYAVVAAVIVLAVTLYIGIRILLKKNLKVYISLVILMAIAIFAGTTVIMSADIRLQTMGSFAQIIFSNYCVDRAYGFGSNLQAPFIMVIVILPCLLYMLSREKEDSVRRQNRIFMILVNAGFLVYAAVVYLTNFYGRGLNQTVKAKQCERYLFGYIIVFVLLYISIILRDMEKTSLYPVVIGLLVFTAVFISDLGIFYRQTFVRSEVARYDAIEKVDIEYPDVVYFIDEIGDENVDRFNFELSPGRIVSKDYIDMHLSTLADEPHKITLEEWTDKLKECRYVFLAAVDDNFAEEYGSIFEDEIALGHFYSVIVDGENVRLKIADMN